RPGQDVSTTRAIAPPLSVALDNTVVGTASGTGADSFRPSDHTNELRCIEVAVGRAHAMIDSVLNRSAAKEHRSISEDSIGIGVLTRTAAENAERRTGLEGDDPGRFPSAHPSILLHKRNFVVEIRYELVADVEVGPTPIQVDVEVIHRVQTQASIE